MQAARGWRVLAAALAFCAAAAGQQLHPGRPPQPVLPAPASGAAGAAPPSQKQAPQPKPSPQAQANALPGQQFTPSKQPWTTHDYSPAQARHDLQVAHFYFIRHNYAAALSRTQGALRHNPHWPPALYAGGLAETKLKQWKAARGYWEEYLRRAPRGKKARAIAKALRRFPGPQPSRHR